MSASADRVMCSTAVPFECPHCAVLAQHNRLSMQPGYTDVLGLHTPEEATDVFEYTAIVTHVVVRCVNCNKDTYFAVRSKTGAVTSGIVSPPFPPSAKAALEKIALHETLHQFPVSTPTSHPAVPEGVKSAAIEAEKCLAVGAPNGCGTMTRRAIHSLCQDKKAQGDDLFKQLKDLKERQLITPDLHEWADSLRVLGRDGAHPEFPEVTLEDAEDGVRLLREIVKYVYILPDERAKKRQKPSK